VVTYIDAPVVVVRRADVSTLWAARPGNNAVSRHVREVSQTIRKLERRVGVPLFTRTSRHVELSPVGRRLHDDLRPAWASVNAALARAIEAGMGFTGSLRVCFTGAAAGQLLVGVIELFHERHPDCDVRIREAQLIDPVPWLRDGTVDIALATFPASGAGHGVFPVGANARRYYARPDAAYVHLHDAPPVEWGLMWRADAATAAVRVFGEAARDHGAGNS
jgi:DNA-binding transcriptional LysR family regulator